MKQNNVKNNILTEIVPSIGGRYMKQTKSNNWNPSKHFGLSREEYDSLSSDELYALRLSRARESSKRSYTSKACSVEECLEYFSSTYGGNWVYNIKYNIFVSDLGRIGSKYLRLIGEHPHNHGYRNFRGTTVHRIIWETFKGEIPEGMDIDHIDENRANCALSNLQCITHKENVEKRDVNGAPMTGRHGSQSPRSKPVIQMDMDGNFIKEWDNACMAAKSIGCHQSSISDCCLGNIKSIYGFKWKFKGEENEN